MDADMTYTKADALIEIADSWALLWRFVDGLDDAQLSSPTDAQGWAVKDHLGHLAAWERSIVFLLTGRTRYDGLGVEREVYGSGDFDAINDAIFQRTRLQVPQAVMEELRQVHAETLVTLDGKSDDELLRSYADYARDEPGVMREGPVAAYVIGNTAHHYQDHLKWMREIVAGT